MNALLPPAVNERLHHAFAPEVGATSGIAAADQPEHQSFVYWPELKSKYQLTEYDLKETRRRSQWLVMNTYARVIRGLGRYLGTPAVKANTRDLVFNKAVDRWWQETYVDRAGNYEMSGKFTQPEFLTNAIFQAWRDSDCTGVHLTKPDGEPTCSAIEAARIDQNWHGGLNTDWQDGVLVDSWDRHLAYSVRTNPPGQRGRWAPAEYSIIPAGHCHMFGDFESQGSVRGTPALIHCVSNLLSARQIDEANLTLLKIAQQFGIVFTSEVGGASAAGVPGTSVSGPKRREEIHPGTVATPTGNSTASGAAATTQNALGKRMVTEVAGGAELVPLPPGVKAQMLQSQQDAPAQMEIKEDIYRQVALGLGVPVELLFLLEKLTGPGIRFVLRRSQEWRNHWLKKMQTWMSADWARRVDWAMRTGRIPKCKDPEFARHYFQNPRAMTIDDGRSMSAMVASLDAGITNLTEIWGEKGGDAKEEITARLEEIQHTLAECERLKVPPAFFFTKVRPDLAGADTAPADAPKPQGKTNA